MRNQDHLLCEKSAFGLNNMYSHLGAQMAAPFYVLSNFFLTAGNLQSDVVRLMNKKSAKKDEREMFTLGTSNISPKVYSILEQKAQANELEDYITKLVEQDLNKLDKEEAKLGEQKLDKEEVQTLINSLRSEFLDEINLLKNELAFRPVVPADQTKSKPAMEQAEEVNDFKEGQFLESDQVTGTIKEVIDMDF
jgi:hypothetical protein